MASGSSGGKGGSRKKKAGKGRKSAARQRASRYRFNRQTGISNSTPF